MAKRSVPASRRARPSRSPQKPAPAKGAGKKLARVSKPRAATKGLRPPTPPTPPAPAISAISVDPVVTLVDVAHARTLFWQDCVRQMLTGLSMIQADHPELFDGRTAILTNAGERIPIAEVFPLFACGLPTSDHTKAASIAVECTVFRVRTPTGEVFTLPVHEIRALHTLTPELIKEIEQNAMAEHALESSGVPSPFGFAAYTPRPHPSPAGPVDSAL